jgi:hypothetical protein
MSEQGHELDAEDLTEDEAEAIRESQQQRDTPDPDDPEAG